MGWAAWQLDRCVPRMARCARWRSRARAFFPSPAGRSAARLSQSRVACAARAPARERDGRSSPARLTGQPAGRPADRCVHVPFFSIGHASPALRTPLCERMQVSKKTVCLIFHLEQGAASVSLHAWTVGRRPPRFLEAAAGCKVKHACACESNVLLPSSLDLFC
jgi:hypothetical protein